MEDYKRKNYYIYYIENKNGIKYDNYLSCNGFIFK